MSDSKVLDDLQERVTCLEYKFEDLQEPPGERFWKLERTVKEFIKESQQSKAEEQKRITALEKQVTDLKDAVASVRQRLDHEFKVTFGTVEDWFKRHIGALADSARQDFALKLQGEVQKAIDDAVARAFEREAKAFSAILSEGDEHV